MPVPLLSVSWVSIPVAARATTVRQARLLFLPCFESNLCSGYLCPNPLSVPLECPTGQYADYSRAVACQSCPEGHQCKDPANSPVPCIAGTYSMGGSCLAGEEGYFSPERAGICFLCPSGFSCQDAASEPLACPAGTFSEAGSTLCSTCAQGSYSPQASSLCLPCPPGYDT